MSYIILLFAVAALAICQLALPSRFAFLPLVVASCHLGNVEVLPQLTPARLMIVVGLARALGGGYFAGFRRSPTDFLCVVFACFALLSSVGHSVNEFNPSPISSRIGLCLNVVGAYLYGRAYLPDLDSIIRYSSLLCVVLTPLAFGMAVEKRTGRNLYAILGASRDQSTSREDKIRASGPFRHPILAGSLGATTLPLAVLVYRRRRLLGTIGLGSSLLIVLACSSSGPLAAVAVAVGFVALWRWRHLTSYLIWTVLLLGLVYNSIKGRGPWYIMASLDLVGGSTGWHRAKLIDQGIHYFGEWWLWGSDFTRHWMSSGVSWNPNHIDITNYYLHLGITGGFVLTLCLVGFIWFSLSAITRTIHWLDTSNVDSETVFAIWCVGVSIAAHAVSFVSISYFDQMYVFFYILVGSIPSIVSNLEKAENESHPDDHPMELDNALLDSNNVLNKFI